MQKLLAYGIFAIAQYVAQLIYPSWKIAGLLVIAGIAGVIYGAAK